MELLYDRCYVAVGAIIEQNGRFLLVRENSGPDKGKWSHPAGWLDLAESPIEGVTREVKEETGLDFRPSAVLGIYSNVRRDLEPLLGQVPHPVKIIFKGYILGPSEGLNPQFDMAEVSESRWFQASQIAEMSPYELRHLDIKQQIHDYIAGRSYPLELIFHMVQRNDVM